MIDDFGVFFAQLSELGLQIKPPDGPILGL